MCHPGIYRLSRGWTRKRSGSTISWWLWRCCCDSPAETPGSPAATSPRATRSELQLAIASSFGPLKISPGKPDSRRASNHSRERRRFRGNAARAPGAAEKFVPELRPIRLPALPLGVMLGPVKLQGFGLSVRSTARGLEEERLVIMEMDPKW